MSVPDASTLPLKVTINKQKSKVLLAEANSDVVDVLLSFLTLPLGNIVRILEKHYAIDEVPVVGSLTTLYRGLSNLDTSHFCVAGAKQMLLNPTSSFQKEYWRLKLDITEPRKIYFCQDSKCPNSQAINVSLYSDIANCVCGKPLNRESFVKEKADLAKVGVFMIKSSSYIICDDLRAVAVDSGFLQTLNYLGITDGAEMSILSIDNIDDIMDLLKFSLISTTPLTDLVMKKTQKSSITATKPEPEDVLHDFQTHLSRINSRKMSLKILLQKSSSKFLLAVASDEFVEFLFSLLAIPLGGVEYLLGGNTCLKNIDNLYTSVRDVFDNKCFTTPDMKQRLLNPKLPHGYIYKNQFLPLREESPPPLFFEDVPMVFKSSKRHGSFMKERTMFSVNDDLTVTPFSITSSISIPNDLGIALSDVTEKDFQIGLEEALSILKTSLSSTTVFTDALINPMLNKPPKQPKIEPCSLFINLVGLLVSSFVMSLCIGSFWGGINH